jgi:hypothetical protein
MDLRTSSLDKVFNESRAVRVITFSRFDANSQPLFQKLDIMPLKNDYFLIALYIYLQSFQSFVFFEFNQVF